METKVYFKETAEFTPPEDKMYYVLTSDGLMMGRNHQFFQSLVKVKTGPSELEPQEEFLRLRYPKFPKELLQQVVGFFSLVQKKYNSEAALLIAWNTQTSKYELICPKQEVPYAGMHVDFEVPNLPGHLLNVGTIHSHVNMEAFSSMTDEDDETNRPGIHIVVGHICQEPPQLHIVGSVDGSRFTVPQELFIEDGYTKRDENGVPKAWFKLMKVGKKPKIVQWKPGNQIGFGAGCNNAGYHSGAPYSGKFYNEAYDYHDGSYDDVYDGDYGINSVTGANKDRKTTDTVGTTFHSTYKPGQVWVDGEWRDPMPAATATNGNKIKPKETTLKTDTKNR